MPGAQGTNGEQRGREKQKGEAGGQPERKLGPGFEHIGFLSRTWNSLIIFEKYVPGLEEVKRGSLRKLFDVKIVENLSDHLGLQVNSLSLQI